MGREVTPPGASAESARPAAAAGQAASEANPSAVPVDGSPPAIIPAGPTRHTDALPADPVPDWAAAVFQPHAISVDAGFFTWEIATGVVVCDPITARLHGLPEQASEKLGDLKMDDFLARVPEADLPGVIEAMQRMVGACGTYQIEYRVRGEGGALRSMEARGRMLPGPDGSPARMIGVAMDTTSLRAQWEAEQRRLREGADRARRMQEFTITLASAITVDAIVAAAREGLRAYGADSFIMAAEVDGRAAVVASHGFSKAAVAALSGLASGRTAPMTTAVQWRSPVFLSSPEELVGDYPHLASLVDHLPQRAWAVLPAADFHGKAGACLFGFPVPHDFEPSERALLVAVSGLLAQSVERARMHDAQHALATELQRGMLPTGTLSAPGITMVTRYQAATSGMEIGGDFYDVIGLSGGRVALVIGDVQGHNLFAASLMGRLRTAVHAYAREDHGPAEVMARTNQWLTDLNADPDRARFATCCFVVLQPATGEVTMCRAGHPPPILLPPGAAPVILDMGGDPPLGIEAGTRYEEISMLIEPGSVLVLTTDGLLETDSDQADYNLQCLLDALRRGGTGDLDLLADDLLGVPRRPSRHGDDIALLLARLDPAG